MHNEPSAFYYAIITSLVASGIFIILMLILKSLVTVSKSISKQIDKETGELRYFIKIMNYSPLKLFEIQLSAKLLKNSYNMCAGGGLNKQASGLTLTKEKLPYISEYKVFKRIFIPKSE